MQLIDRRQLMCGLVGSAVGTLAWREAVARGGPGPLYLACRADPKLRYHLTALDAEGRVQFDLDLPDRGHGLALHPTKPVGVAFARRPGRFALVFDHAQGAAVLRFDAAPNRHFYGHGSFSADGRYLFTTENDYETGRGVIGVRDADDGYRQLSEIDAGGIGPHELVLMPDGQTLAIANGGIRTHPDRDREKLNLDTMRPSLTTIEAASGRLLAVRELESKLHQNSIRHLDVNSGGGIALALQFEGPDDAVVPLVGLSRGDGIRTFELPEAVRRRARQYIGSIAFDLSGQYIAASAPKGGLVLFFEGDTGRYLGAVELRDGCGVARGQTAGSFLLTSGIGQVAEVSLATGAPVVEHRQQYAGSLFDNHARSTTPVALHT